MDWNVEGWWIAVNIVVAAAGPWFANGILFLIEHNNAEPGEKDKVKWGPWDAYRDGQLGFVAVGWAAAALYDIGTHKCLYPNPGLTQAQLIACLVGGALFAAQGARKPVKGTFVTAKTSLKKRLLDRVVFYPVFSLTLFFALVSLGNMLVVHFTVAGHDCK